MKSTTLLLRRSSSPVSSGRVFISLLIVSITRLKSRAFSWNFWDCSSKVVAKSSSISFRSTPPSSRESTLLKSLTEPSISARDSLNLSPAVFPTSSKVPEIPGRTSIISPMPLIIPPKIALPPEAGSKSLINPSITLIFVKAKRLFCVLSIEVESLSKASTPFNTTFPNSSNPLINSGLLRPMLLDVLRSV